MNRKLREKVREAFASVLPITLIVLGVSVIFVPMSLGTLVMFLAGAAMLIVGMGFFSLGAEMSMTRMGEDIGAELTKNGKIWLISLAAFLLGFIITIAEPDLTVLANQVPAIADQVLIITVAAGVGVFLAISMLRVVFRIRLSTLLLIFYAIVFLVSIRTPNTFVPIAFDSGGVTTGPMTVPFILSLGLGLASARHDQHSQDDSFGFVALCSTGPILAVLILGIIYNPQQVHHTQVVLPDVLTTQDVAREFALQLPLYLREMLLALLPIMVFLALFQLVSKKYKRRQLLRMAVGILYTLIGLALFLTGVNVGFIPVGNLLGADIALSPFPWLLVPLGMVIGYFVVAAEPAVYVLNRQVEDVTGGLITRRTMGLALSLGVACSLGISMLRILLGLSIYWFLVPGYIAALGLSFFVPPLFTGIAFDSGGVASGPMTSTFLLPFAIGACEAASRLRAVSSPEAVLTDAFGIVAMVAMTPLIAIQILGVVYRVRTERQQAQEAAELLRLIEPDEIIDYEEDKTNESIEQPYA